MTNDTDLAAVENYRRGLLAIESRAVSASQAARLKESLGPQLRYLGRLLARMEKVGFVPSDPLYQKVKAAHDAVHSLNVHVHYSGATRGEVPVDRISCYSDRYSMPSPSAST